MYFIGDTHGVPPIFSIVDKAQLENENLYHVGDLGIGFQNVHRDITNLVTLDEMLGETGNKLWVIRGNHDNPIFWDKKRLYMPRFHNIRLVEDYEIVEIEGKKILGIGGAISIDRAIRETENPPSWWADEVFNLDIPKLRSSIDAVDKVDIVVTHTAPNYAYPFGSSQIVDHYAVIENQHGRNLIQNLKDERFKVTQVHEILKSSNKNPSNWLYGHFHVNKATKTNDTEFRALGICELYKL